FGEGLYGSMAAGYWEDIGTPERCLEATYDLLADRVRSTLPPRDETGSLIGEGCITSGARIGPMSVLGRHCSVGDESIVERSVLLDNVRVGSDCLVTGAVLAEGVRVEDRPRTEAPGGLVVAGMGGSAIGGDLAAAIIGDRARAPVQTVRGYSLPPWIAPDTLVLCSSYSGQTEETLSAYRAAGELVAPRAVVTTGGELGELARADGVPVIG